MSDESLKCLSNIANDMKKVVTLDLLAEMIKKGFDGVDERFETSEKSVNARFDVLEKDVRELKVDVRELKGGQDDILLKLNNMVYRFEFRDLEGRVTFLEKHAGLTAKPKPAR